MKRSSASEKTKKSTPVSKEKTIDVPQPPVASSSRKFSQRWMAVGVLAILLVAVFATQKGLLFAAVVNGKPIFKWDLHRVLVTRFGQQTIEGMISELLVKDAATQAGVTVTDTEVEQKIQQILGSLGPNVKLEDVLKYQGMTKESFDEQIRLQLLVQKILGKDVTVSDEEINTFITENKATLVATEEGALKEEARQAVFDQKVGEKVQPWFAELKEKAKIYKFL